uniref:Uncharacterized protein n=1 Tax=Leersia perrieri TaxID=77586 RepID=A0A0D9VV35_9ORYZ
MSRVTRRQLCGLVYRGWHGELDCGGVDGSAMKWVLQACDGPNPDVYPLAVVPLLSKVGRIGRTSVEEEASILLSHPLAI